MPKKKLVIIFLTIVFTALFIMQCNKTDDSEAIQLLKERQVASQKRQQLIDSLKQEQIKDQTEKKELIEKMNVYKEDKLTSEQSVIKTLQLQKAERENELLRIGQELEAVNFRISELEKREKEMSNQSAYTDTAKIRAKQHVRDEISGIDLIMDSLEKEQQLDEKKIPILTKKMEISEKKLAALDEEYDLYLDQKNNLIRSDGSEQALSSVNSQIAEIDDEINTEKQKYVQAESDINRSKSRIAEIDIQLEQMIKSIQQKQSKKEALSEFISAEEERLKSEKVKIAKEIELLVNEKASLKKNKQSIQNKIALLNEKIEEIDEDYEETGTGEDVISKSEIEIIDDEELTEIESIKKPLENKKSGQKKKELSSLNDKIEQDKSTVDSDGVSLTVIIILASLAILFILILYFVGRKNKSKNEIN